MEAYVECAKLLDELLAGALAVRITVPGYMPLSVEDIGCHRITRRECPLNRGERRSRAQRGHRTRMARNRRS